MPLGGKVGGEQYLARHGRARLKQKNGQERPMNERAFHIKIHSVAKNRIFVTQLGIRRGRKGPYKGDERERESERDSEKMR